MGLLEHVTKPKREPIVATIVGTAGSGKTSLATTFPAPLVVRTQGESIPRDIPRDQMPDVLPEELMQADNLWAVLKALREDDHAYKTLVIDSCTGLEQLFVADVLAADGKARGINQAFGGFGAGPNAVMAMHMRVRRMVEALRKERGMHTLFLAHADIARIDPPDSDGYSQYSLRLPGKSMAPYVDNVDLVGFLKQSMIVKDAVAQKDNAAAKPGKAISTGDRVLVTYMTPATVAKNRFGIEDDLPVEKGVNPLAFLIEPRRRKQAQEEQPVEEGEAA